MERRYTSDQLSRKAYLGRDTVQFGYLLPLARSLGFDVHFGDADYVLFGTADDDGGRYNQLRQRYGERSSGPDTDSDREVEMGDVDERTLKVLNFRDYDGSPLQSEPQSISSDDDESDLIPIMNALEELEDEGPDDTDYDGFSLSEGAGSMTYSGSHLFKVSRPGLKVLLSL
jgi:hypothetical protein